MDEALLDELCPAYDPTRLPRVLSRAEALRRGYSRKAIEHRAAHGRWEQVLTPYASGHRSTRWVQVRPTERMPPQRRLAPGPARAEVARAVADLALVTPRVDDVRALVTEALRRRMCTIEKLGAELDAGPRRGSAHLRRAIDEASDGAWSAPEAHTGALLRRASIPPFEQNAVIPLPDSTTVVADFLWRALRAILEIDSQKHLPGDRDATDERHLKLEALGYSVVHRTPWPSATGQPSSSPESRRGSPAEPPTSTSDDQARRPPIGGRRA